MGELIRERRKDLERSSSIGYQDAYEEDEGYGFKEGEKTEPKPESRESKIKELLYSKYGGGWKNGGTGEDKVVFFNDLSSVSKRFNLDYSLDRQTFIEQIKLRATNNGLLTKIILQNKIAIYRVDLNKKDLDALTQVLFIPLPAEQMKGSSSKAPPKEGMAQNESHQEMAAEANGREFDENVNITDSTLKETKPIPFALQNPLYHNIKLKEKKKTSSVNKIVSYESDKPQVSSGNEKMIKLEMERRMELEQQKIEFAGGDFSSFFARSEQTKNKETVSATSLRHPGVDRQSFQMATQDRVFQTSAVALFAAGTAVVAGEVAFTEVFKKVFQTKIKKAAADIVKDAFGQFVVNGGDINEIDWANVIASGFVKNNTLKNLIASAIDIDANGLDSSKYENWEGVERSAQEFLIRELADDIFNAYKAKAGSNFPENFNADIIYDIIKKEYRDYTNKGLDKIKEVINGNTDERQNK